MKQVRLFSVTLLFIACSAAVRADVSVTSTLETIPGTPSLYGGDATEVDYWYFTVNTDGIITIDIFSDSWDADSDGIAHYIDSQIFVFTDDGVLDASDLIAFNDDGLPGADGSRDRYGLAYDSYLSIFFAAGDYVLAMTETAASEFDALGGINVSSYTPIVSADGGVTEEFDAGGCTLDCTFGDYKISFTGDVTVLDRGPNAADVTTFADVTGDAVPDVATYTGEYAGKPRITVFSGANGGAHSTVEFLNDNWGGVALGTLRDANQDGVAGDPAVAMLAVNKDTGKIRVETRRLDNGAKVNSIQFLNENWRAIDVVVVDDFNGDGVTSDTAILVLAERISDGRIQVQARDFIGLSTDGDLVSNSVYLNANWSPVAAAVADRSAVMPAGTLAPLVGVLAENSSNGRRTMQSRVVVPGPAGFAFDQNIKFLGSTWSYKDMSVDHDANGDGMNDDPVWQVLATRPSDDVIRVQSRFVADGTFDENIAILNSGWQGLRLDVANDMGGSSSGEMAISAKRLSDGVRRIHIKDYGSRATTINIAP